MASNSIGIVAFSGIHVSSQLTYIPAHIKQDGKRVNAQVKIPVGFNSSRAGIDPATGEPRKEWFTLVAWGKLADTCARTCFVGKELAITGRPNHYTGTLFMNRQPMVGPDGQPIKIMKVSYVIDQITFGADSQRHIDDEIARGIRPPQWNVKNTQDAQIWQQICRQRLNEVWDGKSETFGAARVFVPQGVTVDFSQAPAVQPGQAQGSGVFVGQQGGGTMIRPGQPNLFTNQQPGGPPVINPPF